MSSPARAASTPGARAYRICFAVGMLLMAATLGLGFVQVASTQHGVPGLSRDIMAGAQDALAKGQKVQAVREFRKAAEVSTADYAFLLSAAEGLGHAGDLPGALALVDQAERLSPGRSRAATVRGWAQLVNGQTGEAFSSFIVALNRDQKDAAAIAGVGEGLVVRKRYDEAFAMFERSLRADPRRAETYDGYGIALAQAGRPGDAVRQFAAALALRPTAVRRANLDRARAESAAAAAGTVR
jgi:tetratricopeptide (TPR) repeat protein